MEADFRVQFVIGGAQKGGTTALYSYLVQHPGLFMPRHLDGLAEHPHREAGEQVGGEPQGVRAVLPSDDAHRVF